MTDDEIIKSVTGKARRLKVGPLGILEMYDEMMREAVAMAREEGRKEAAAELSARDLLNAFRSAPEDVNHVVPIGKGWTLYLGYIDEDGSPESSKDFDSDESLVAWAAEQRLADLENVTEESK